MMGRREGRTGPFFYEFNLDEVVPPDHLVRQIDAVLDLGWVHKELAPYYSHTGRPSIDPVLMIRMLIVGYVFAIRSERRICAEVQVNLAYRWFCRLGIEDKIPDHSVFSRARHERFRESDALRRVFERVVGLCIAAGLVGGEAFSIDASLIKADVDKKKRSPATSRSIGRSRRRRRMRFVSTWRLSMPPAAMRRVAAEMAGGSSSSGGGKPPKEVSLTDPQAAWVARKGVDPFFAYDANYLIDNKFGIILDADGTRANRSDEMAIAETMVDRVERRFDLQPQRLAGDTAYGAAKLLKWLVDRKHHAARSGVGQVRAIRRQVQPGRLRLRQGAQRLHLPSRGRTHALGNIDQGRISSYRASKNDCSICKLKPKCTTAIARKVSRDIDEDVRDQVRALANTEAFQLSRRERKKVEVRFAHMKRILKLDRLRLRGLSGARDEVLLTATAQNLRRLAKLLCRAPPPLALACPA